MKSIKDGAGAGVGAWAALTGIGGASPCSELEGGGRCRVTAGFRPAFSSLSPFPSTLCTFGGTAFAMYLLCSYLSRINFSITRTESPSFGRAT